MFFSWIESLEVNHCSFYSLIVGIYISINSGSTCEEVAYSSSECGCAWCFMIHDITAGIRAMWEPVGRQKIRIKISIVCNPLSDLWMPLNLTHWAFKVSWGGKTSHVIVFNQVTWSSDSEIWTPVPVWWQRSVQSVELDHMIFSSANPITAASTCDCYSPQSNFFSQCIHFLMSWMYRLLILSNLVLHACFLYHTNKCF